MSLVGECRCNTKTPRRNRVFCVVTTTLLLLLALATEVCAQVNAVPPRAETETITLETVQSRRAAADQATDLDSDVKQNVLETYDQAAELLKSAVKSAGRVAELKAMIDSVAEVTAKVNEDLNRIQKAPPDEPQGDESLETLKARRIEKEAALAKAKEEMAVIEAEIARRVAGQKEIPNLLIEARKRLADTTDQLRVPMSPETLPAVVLAQQTFLLAKKESIERSIAAQEKELVVYEATADLIPLEQKLAAAKMARLEEETKAWRGLEGRMAEQEAKRKSEEARLAAIQADPALQPMAAENQRLAELAETRAASFRKENQSQVDIKAKLEEVQKQFQRARDRVDIVGLTNTIGLLLRTQKSLLPDVQAYYREAKVRQTRIRDIQMTLFDLEDSRMEAGTAEKQVEIAMADVRKVPTTIPAEELEAVVREFLTKREEYRDSAIKNHYDCLRTLGDSEVVQKQLIQEVEAFTDYIDQRVLWIQSARTMRLADLRLSAGILRIGVSTDPDGLEGWLDVLDTWRKDAMANSRLYGAAVIIVLGCFVFRRKVRKSLVQLGKNAALSAQVRIWPTFQALVGTVLVGSFWPALIFLAGYRLGVSVDGDDFAKAVGLGMMYAAEWWLPLELLRQLCRPQGLGELHFAWPAGGLRSLRGHLRWLCLLGTPLVFLVMLLDAQGSVRWQNSLGRLTFLALMLLIAVFVHLVLRPSGTLFRHLQAANPDGWFFRIRSAVYWVGIGTPLALGLAAFWGYYYTSLQLTERVLQTVLLALGLVIASALLSRWILVVRRRLAIERMRQRRSSDQRGTSGDDAATIANIPAAPVEQEVDLSLVTDQTRRFVNGLLIVVGILLIWWIWVEVLPALTFLDRVPLWRTSTTVSEAITMSDGSTAVRTLERPGHISLADLGLAVLILFVTTVAAKNIPGLLRISLPQRLRLDAGLHYAITTLTRYAVITLGVILGFNALGLSWSKLQWLVAALTVGLGFGLQEIFANFVSGLILLFERPIRVGDVVTVEDTTGVVTRIQTRATTVTNWDRKEFIVPNKEFITGRLLNWTRTDQVTRIVVEVGVAYGSDTERACQIIREILANHQEILEEPSPLVTFEGFGDSTLNLVARCYLAKLDRRRQVNHELHTAIDRAFREAKIEIAFPQRDIHIRSAVAPKPEAQEHSPGDAND